MKIERGIKITVFATLLLISTICYLRISVKEGNADALPTTYPVVYVYPSNVTANVGDRFTIAVIVHNLTDARVHDPYGTSTIPLGNLVGFDIQFSWDPTVIRYVNYTNPGTGTAGVNKGYFHPNVTAPIEKYLNPVSPSPFPGVIHGYGSPPDLIWVNNIVNETGNMSGARNANVRAWFAGSTVSPPAVPFNGNGTIFVMTFQVLRNGSCALKIEFCTLADKDGNSIGRSPVGGDNGIWLNPPRDGIFNAAGAPSADFSYSPALGLVNKSMQFSASIIRNDTPIQKYMWNFGDGAAENTTTPTVEHIYTKVPSATDVYYSASLVVMDELGSTSATITKQIAVATIRDLKITGLIVKPSGSVKPNNAVSVTANVQNLGQYSDDYHFSEICNATAFCNVSSVDPQNPTSAIWHQIGTNTTTLAIGVSGQVVINFNSLTFPVTESKYYFLVNITGIPVEFENSTTNNMKISAGVLWYTSQTVHQPTISTFAFGYERGRSLKLPVITGENASFNIVVKNDGNDNDTFTLTLYANGSVVNTWQTPVLTFGESWNTSELLQGTVNQFEFYSHEFDTGYYNLTLALNASSILRIQQESLRVIAAPQLAIVLNPESPGQNQEVTFDATTSTEPGGVIEQYSWMIYAPGKPTSGPATKTFPPGNESVIKYTLNQTGIWTIVLIVKDDSGITYDTSRSATNSYREEITVTIGGGFPIEWIVTIVVLVAVLIVVVALLLRRRRLRMTPPPEQTS